MLGAFSQACENNKGPILAHLRAYFASSRSVLELGSGTGQHAVHFAEHLPHLCWQCSDLAPALPGLRDRIEAAGLSNLLAPIELDVLQQDAWPIASDAMFTANTLHIMPWPVAEHALWLAGTMLPAQGVLIIYGPFNYQGLYTSDSNAEFDQWLKQRAPHQGIRDFEAVNACLEKAGMSLHTDHAMPANNRLLVYVKKKCDMQVD